MKTLRRNDKSDDVIELQLKLAGFRGTTWDGDFGPGTELQVRTFQTEFMKDRNPDGIVGPKTWSAVEKFTSESTVNFNLLKCPCGKCDGFGQNRFKNTYRQNKPKIEAYYNYEYPGIHRAVLHTFQAAIFYAKQAGLPIPYCTSGYRCTVNNQQKARKSTNHMGKAIDIDFPMVYGEDKKDDFQRCESFRSLLVEKCNFQLGWNNKNAKSLEPSNIAPTWVHMDVRSYERKYLDERYFTKSHAGHIVNAA